MFGRLGGDLGPSGGSQGHLGRRGNHRGPLGGCLGVLFGAFLRRLGAMGHRGSFLDRPIGSPKWRCRENHVTYTANIYDNELLGGSSRSSWNAKACVGPASESTSPSRCAKCIAFAPSQCGLVATMLRPPCCAAAGPSTFFIASWLSGPFAVPAFSPRGCPEAVLELSGSCPGMSGVVPWLSGMPFSPHRGVAPTDASRGLLNTRVFNDMFEKMLA